MIMVDIDLSGFEFPIDSTSMLMYYGKSKINSLTSNSMSDINYFALENYIFLIKGHTASIFISSTFLSSDPEF